MVSALDTALLLGRKFDSYIEGFPLRPAVAELVAVDPDSGLTDGGGEGKRRRDGAPVA